MCENISRGALWDKLSVTKSLRLRGERLEIIELRNKRFRYCCFRFRSRSVTVPRRALRKIMYGWVLLYWPSRPTEFIFSRDRAETITKCALETLISV